MSKDTAVEKFKIVAVVLSYNNKGNLRKLIPALLSQTYSLREIVVVDNASSDGTIQMLNKKFPQVTLLANSSNLGVGEGYAKGMQYAFKKRYDWVWLLDGDSLPQVTALEELIKVFTRLKDAHPKIGILASSPVNSSTGRRYEGALWRGRFVKIPKELASSQEPFLVDTVISSGSLIYREAIKDVGLPRADFFIDFVDHEYNLRVRKKGYQIVYIPKSIIYHEIGNTIIVRSVTHFGKRWPSANHPPWRLYYMVRNQVYTHLHEFRNYKALRFTILKILKMMIGILLHYQGKRQRFMYIVLGFRDGLKKRLGKVIKPAKERGSGTIGNE